MLKYRSFLLLTLAVLLQPVCLMAQESELDYSGKPEENLQPQKLSLGVAFDYLKLHTLLLDDAEKWEAAVNIRIYERASVIGEYGMASLSPEDAYKNAEYLSEGTYYRVGADYHFEILPGNYLLLGLRYAEASFDESFTYLVENPLFENQTGFLYRPGLNATWFEFVLTSEKDITKIFRRPIPKFATLGFKFRLKSLQSYPSFDDFELKRIPGYGMSNTKLNPEFNLFIKFRMGIIK